MSTSLFILLVGLCSPSKTLNAGETSLTDDSVCALPKCATTCVDTYSSFSEAVCTNYTVPSGDETYTLSGVYNDTIPNVSGCDSILTINVTILPAPSVSFWGSPVAGCNPLNVNFASTTIVPGPTRLWKFGDGTEMVTSSLSVNHLYTAPGAYTVTLIETGVNGCSDSIQILDFIHVYPKPVLNSFSDVELCDSTIYYPDPFILNFSDSYVYVGINGPSGGIYGNYGVGSSGAIVPPIVIDLDTNIEQTFTIVAVETTSYGCMDTSKYHIHVHPNPDIEIVSSETVICDSAWVEFLEQTIPASVNCTWDFGNGMTANACGPVSTFYNASGTYDVSLTAETALGCVDSMTFNNFISVGTYQQVDLGLDLEVCDDSVLLDAGPFFGIYYWNDLSTEQTLWVTSSGDYSVLVDSLSCESADTVHVEFLQTYANISTYACSPTLSPSGLYTWSATGVYQDTILNSMGCDSVMTINFTLDPWTASIFQFEYSLTAYPAGISYQWLNCETGFSEISGETFQVFNPVESGEYAVEASYNGCVDTSDCVLISGLGFSGPVENGKIQVYPNPTNGNITINLPDNYWLNCKIEIINEIGQIVLVLNQDQINKQHNLPLPSGNYQVRFTNDSRIELARLVIR